MLEIVKAEPGEASEPLFIQFGRNWRLFASSKKPYRAVLQMDRGFGDDIDEAFINCYSGLGQLVELSSDGRQYIDVTPGSYRLKHIEGEAPIELRATEAGSVAINRFAKTEAK